MWDSLPSIFEGLAPEVVEDALSVFQTVDVEAGAHLMEEGEEDPSLVVVQQGELEMVTGGTRLGRAANGDVVGEMALFGSGMRTATVTATRDSRLLLLDQEGYHALRQLGHPVAAAIEDHALSQLTARLRTTSQRIASLAEGTELARTVPPQGFLDRVSSVLNPGSWLRGASGASVLAESPLFSEVEPEVLAEVAAYFQPVDAGGGQFLCTQGETGADMYVVASGAVEVVVAVTAERTQHLATVERGEAFGMCALLHPDQPRMASCVARGPVRALSLDKIRFTELIGRTDMAGSAMRVACIRALIDKVAFANGQLSQLDLRRARREANDPAVTAEYLRAATAAMEAHGSYVARSAAMQGPPRPSER